MARERTTSSDQRLFAVASAAKNARNEARRRGPALVRSALAATEPSPPGEPSITQRYSRAQTERARRGIALARQELGEAA